jgi:hypothetical protein
MPFHAFDGNKGLALSFEDGEAAIVRVRKQQLVRVWAAAAWRTRCRIKGVIDKLYGNYTSYRTGHYCSGHSNSEKDQSVHCGTLTNVSRVTPACHLNNQFVPYTTFLRTWIR